MWHIIAIGYLFVTVMFAAAQPSVARALTVQLSRAFQAQLPYARLAVSEGLSTSLLESLVALDRVVKRQPLLENHFNA